MRIRTRKKRNAGLKKILKLKLSFYNKLKIIFLRKQKWQRFLTLHSLKWSNKTKQKYSIFDQTILHIQKSNNLLTKNLKNTLLFKQQIKCFYGNLLKRYLQNKVYIFIKNRNFFYKSLKSANSFFIEKLSKRIDSLLYKAKLFLTLFNSKQAIAHCNVFVNNFVVTVSSFVLNCGDFVRLGLGIYSLVKKFVSCFVIWPNCPKNCKVNYKILQIFYVENSKISTRFSDLPLWFNFQSIVKLYR